MKSPYTATTRTLPMHHKYLKTAIACILLGTALLKLWFLKGTNAIGVTDPAFSFFLLRDVLFIAIVFEASISYCILRSRSSVTCGLLTLYFCLGASIYQLAAITSSTKTCNCLGNVSMWFDLSSNQTRLFTWTLLGIMWFIGLYLLKPSVK